MCILFPFAANNMNLLFTTFFSRAKFAGEIAIFLNILSLLIYVIFIVFNANEPGFFDSNNDTIKYDIIAHFLALIPHFAFCEGVFRIAL